MDELDRSFDRILLEINEEYEEVDHTTAIDAELLHQRDTDYYNLLINDEFIEMIVQEANRYGATRDEAFVRAHN
ncbi:hypothetical protein Aduo_003569 [Ancylostoma duodenale]